MTESKPLEKASPEQRLLKTIFPFDDLAYIKSGANAEPLSRSQFSEAAEEALRELECFAKDKESEQNEETRKFEESLELKRQEESDELEKLAESSDSQLTDFALRRNAELEAKIEKDSRFFRFGEFEAKESKDRLAELSKLACMDDCELDAMPSTSCCGEDELADRAESILAKFKQVMAEAENRSKSGNPSLTEEEIAEFTGRTIDALIAGINDGLTSLAARNDADFIPWYSSESKKRELESLSEEELASKIKAESAELAFWNKVKSGMSDCKNGAEELAKFASMQLNDLKHSIEACLLEFSQAAKREFAFSEKNGFRLAKTACEAHSFLSKRIRLALRAIGILEEMKAINDFAGSEAAKRAFDAVKKQLFFAVRSFEESYEMEPRSAISEIKLHYLRYARFARLAAKLIRDYDYAEKRRAR